MKEPRRIQPHRRRGAYDAVRKRPLAAKAERGWGDWLAIGLARGVVLPFVKMTPRRWRKLKVRWGFVDACNCGERKIQLNRFGRRVVKPFREFAARIRKWLKALPPGGAGE